MKNLEALPSKVGHQARMYSSLFGILGLINANFTNVNGWALLPVCLPDVIERDEISQAFPFCFCIQ